MDWETYLVALAAILAIGLMAWVVSVFRRDVSFVDSLWPLFFLVAALIFALPVRDLGIRGTLVLVLVAVWALRLCLHITVRNRGAEEDYRYRTIRAANEPGFWWKSVYIVFGLQSVLAWIVSLALLPAISSPEALSVLDLLALVLWSIGFVFEALGDYQLSRFKADQANQGKILDTGLWRYTRHPNYFGDFCIWWSFYLFSAAAGAWWTIVSPILMSLLLLRVSGVAMLEKTITERRPQYADYIWRTNAFVPGPPKTGLERDRVPPP